MARPTDYTPELAERICEVISESDRGLKTICKRNPDFPNKSTIMRWLTELPEFKDQYARAKELQAEFIADQILEIADNSEDDIRTDDNGKQYVDHDHINRSRLRVESRKWVASKLLPKKYGDKTTLDVNPGEDSIRVINEIIGGTKNTP
jgi:hypothetical protein